MTDAPKQDLRAGVHRASDALVKWTKLVALPGSTRQTTDRYLAARGALERAIDALADERDRLERERDEAVWRAHVPVTGTQHDPMRGLLHGYCERCRRPWPCEYSPESRAKGGGDGDRT